MKKLIIIIFVFIFISCGGSTTSVINNAFPVQTVNKDSLPVTLNDMKRVHPPFFKMFTGVVDNKSITLLVKKSSEYGVSSLFKGFWYWNHGEKTDAVKGNEQVYKGLDASDVASIETEAKLKLDMSFSFISFGNFTGWFKDDQYIGYLSDSSFKKTTPIPSILPIDTSHRLFMVLKEVQIPYVYQSSHLKQPYEGHSLIVNTSMTLPLDSLFRKNLLKAIFGTDLKHIDSLTNYTIQKIFQKKVATAVSNSIHKELYHGSNYYINPSLSVSYLDTNIISFVYECPELRESVLLTYEAQTHQFFKNITIFKANQLDQLKHIILNTPNIQTILNHHYKSEGFDTTQCNKFFLTGAGIVFQFPPTDIILNYTYTFVSYQEVQDCLTDDFKLKLKTWN